MPIKSIDLAVSWYKNGWLDLTEGARIAEISVSEFVEVLNKRKEISNQSNSEGLEIREPT